MYKNFHFPHKSLWNKYSGYIFFNTYIFLLTLVYFHFANEKLSNILFMNIYFTA